MFYLCHKCSGNHSDSVPELHECRCISGYYRGFEKAITLQQAATVQAKQALEWMALYVSQGRDVTEPCYQEELSNLLRAMKTSPAFGHGTINWQYIAGLES